MGYRALATTAPVWLASCFRCASYYYLLLTTTTSLLTLGGRTVCHVTVCQWNGVTMFETQSR